MKNLKVDTKEPTNDKNAKSEGQPLYYDFHFLSNKQKALIEETTRERLETFNSHVESTADRKYAPNRPSTPLERRRKQRSKKEQSIFKTFSFKISAFVGNRTPKARMLKRSATLLTAELENSDRFKDLQEYSVFGTKLSKTMSKQQKGDPDTNIPYILLGFQNALLSHSREEGLFRIPGKKTSMNELRILIEAEFNTQKYEDFKWDDFPPHCLSSLFKLYFKLLPTPLIPFEFYKEISKMCTSSGFEKLPETLAKMPQCHQDVLDFLIGFLCEIAEVEENKMDVMSLAIVFSPNLLRPIVETPESIMRDSKTVRLVFVDLMEEKLAQRLRSSGLSGSKRQHRRRSSLPERGRFGDLKQEKEVELDNHMVARRLSKRLVKTSHAKSMSRSLLPTEE